VALEAYRTRPEGVAGLVLICGAPGRVTHTFKGGDALARALPAIIARVERHPQIARALWSNLPPAAAARVALVAGEVDPELDPADLLAYMEHVANLDVIMFLRMLQSVGEETAEDVLPTVAVPVLVIAGDGDTFTPPPLAERMATTIPDAELMLAAGATHVVPLERREAVRERILGFLQGRVLPRLAPTARAAGRA
jgi:pimeloyl-ACP methyl ester carboxylesterase